MTTADRIVLPRGEHSFHNKAVVVVVGDNLWTVVSHTAMSTRRLSPQLTFGAYNNGSESVKVYELTHARAPDRVVIATYGSDLYKTLAKAGEMDADVLDKLHTRVWVDTLAHFVSVNDYGTVECLLDTQGAYDKGKEAGEILFQNKLRALLGIGGSL